MSVLVSRSTTVVMIPVVASMSNSTVPFDNMSGRW